MRFFSILICSISVSSFLIGCSPHDVAVRATRPALVKNESESVPEVSAPKTPVKEVLVFRGKYYQTTGPCIQLGDSLGMPIIDAFEVVEVLEGKLAAKTIDVRAMTEGGASYPKDMAEGQIYTLRLTPSDKTSKQLRENELKGNSFLWIDGDEIAALKESK